MLAAITRNGAMGKGKLMKCFKRQTLMVLIQVLKSNIFTLKIHNYIFFKGMYEAAIINVESSKPKRSSGYAEKMNKDDFMSNLTPQWPEPEEVPMGQQEYDPFIRNTHNVNGGHSTFDPPILRNHHHHRREQHGSKESISSSWSSLFNVPGTSSGTVSIRPNSVAVSNLSSSGSAADYAAKVAFIGNKYRKSNNS